MRWVCDIREGQTGHCEAIHLPDAWASVVVN